MCLKYVEDWLGGSANLGSSANLGWTSLLKWESASHFLIQVMTGRTRHDWGDLTLPEFLTSSSRQARRCSHVMTEVPESKTHMKTLSKTLLMTGQLESH